MSACPTKQYTHLSTYNILFVNIDLNICNMQSSFLCHNTIRCKQDLVINMVHVSELMFINCDECLQTFLVLICSTCRACLDQHLIAIRDQIAGSTRPIIDHVRCAIKNMNDRDHITLIGRPLYKLGLQPMPCYAAVPVLVNVNC